MPRLKIGVVVENFRLGVKAGLSKAAELGFKGVQVSVARGDLTPENLTETGRRDLLRAVTSRGLQLVALGGDLGLGFASPNELDRICDRTRRILDLALALRVPLVVTDIGPIPPKADSSERLAMRAALTELGRYAENYERFLATETRHEDCGLLKSFLDSLPTQGIKVNYDPGNLVMNGFDSVGGVLQLAAYIVHTHAKDALRTGEGVGREVSLGKGAVPFPEYLAALAEIGYDGFHTIERENAVNPVAELAQAKEFLERF